MNKEKLVDKMRRNGDTNASLALYLGISPQSLSSKKNATNGAQFLAGEIIAIKRKYKLSAKDLNEIFFEEKQS